MQIIVNNAVVLTDGYVWKLIDTRPPTYDYEQVGSVVTIYKAPYEQEGSEVTIL